MYSNIHLKELHYSTVFCIYRPVYTDQISVDVLLYLRVLVNYYHIISYTNAAGNAPYVRLKTNRRRGKTVTRPGGRYSVKMCLQVLFN